MLKMKRVFLFWTKKDF